MNKSFRIENLGDDDKNLFCSYASGSSVMLASGPDLNEVERKTRQILFPGQIECAGNPNSSLSPECAMRGLATMDYREMA